MAGVFDLAGLGLVAVSGFSSDDDSNDGPRQATNATSTASSAKTPKKRTRVSRDASGRRPTRITPVKKTPKAEPAWTTPTTFGERRKGYF